MHVDYSLYLVTDSTPAILKGRDLFAVVEAALEGGVTIVQYRDKTSETIDLIRTAKALHQVTKKHKVPLLINDRVDVALAVGCEGVHLGQDDMDLATARRLLGEDAIIGVTASSKEEAIAAAEGGADYLGIGTLFSTLTKQNTKSIIGITGTREILNELSSLDKQVHTVCIGGINVSNAQRVLYQSRAPSKGLDGIAVVSAIVGADDPNKAASELRRLIATPPPFAVEQADISISKDVIRERVPQMIKQLAETTPLCHNMTNLVVQNFAANVALAVGASPIMSNAGAEAPDLAQLHGSLVINMGTATPDGLTNYRLGLRAYNAAGGAVLLDPVGAGATAQRRDAVKTLLAEGYFDVIKGNEGEVRTVAGLAGRQQQQQQQQQQRGVDSGPSGSSVEERGRVVRDLAARERNVVLMTGAVDVLSDGARTYAIANGHELLGNITGAGCTLGTTIASFLAVHRGERLLAVLAAVLMFEIAAERAAVRGEVRGPGSFVPAFLDELYVLRGMAGKGDGGWLDGAKVEEITGRL